MTDQVKIQRGIEARRLLEDPLIREAFMRMEAEAVDAMVLCDNMQLTSCVEGIRAVRRLKQHLESVSLDGKSVESRLQRQTQ